ncbi:short-chain fatty acyl-CoA regulator family protein [Lacibacterium aquatile]|uniref:Short-chain fatty acyl-CoA regulator family protein n=1 Tax=Lacibacterium aquatile TaxID=1168082 RepID=A0ABW5DVY7_9PROT
MAREQIRLGGKLRRLRQEQRLSQVQMAEQLGISASYLNLLEHNQRAVTVPVLLKLAQRFGIDLDSFTDDDDGRLEAEMMEVFADPLFDGQDIKPADVKELIGAAPSLGRAVLSLYQAFRGSRAPTAAAGDMAGEDDPVPTGMPSEEVTDFIQDKKNHFPDLESAAEALRAEIGDGDLCTGLIRVLAERYAVDVAVVPEASLDGLLRRYDPHSRRLLLSERLPRSSRVFQLAHQIALIGEAPRLDRLVAGGKFTTLEADRLARIALASYFAGAVMMPYGSFLAAVRESRHDFDLLQARFEASLEQVCQRLASLRRPGAQGLPFHFVRIDVAGNVSKRFTASGLSIPRFGSICARWNLHRALAQPGRLSAQAARLPDGQGFLMLAASAPGGRHALGLGVPLGFAKEVRAGDGLDPDAASAIGISCRLCPRSDCDDRAVPSLHHPLKVDENRRARSTYMDARPEDRS